MRNILVVLSGPSGTGKGTVAKLLIDRNPDLKLSISCTTRQPRVGEVDGKDYFFVSDKVFQDKITKDGFLEYSNHFEHFYGTPREFVMEQLKQNDVLLEIDVNGGLNVKKSYKDAVLIMLLPPSTEELRNRLIGRGTETIEQVNIRMDRIQYELSKKELYDYCVINEDLLTAVKAVENIIKKEKNKS